MFSKRFSISSGDLTSGECLKEITITTTATSTSEGTKTRVLSPSAFSCFNPTDAHVNLVFLSSGEYSDYVADRTNYDGIVVGGDSGNGQTLNYMAVPVSRYVNMLFDTTPSKPLIISFFNYR